MRSEAGAAYIRPIRRRCGESHILNSVISCRFIEDLERQARDVLEHAVDGQRRGLRVYESLQNLNEVIGAEYGDRVLYELIQNAHDAHEPGDQGRIEIKLIVRADNHGELYIANDGSGFRKRDVEAIRNLGISAKEIGEGIGNKGLGFRSIEALTDDVRIFSQSERKKQKTFGGYCFRFADQKEIEAALKSYGVDATTRSEVVRTIPRYLVPRPLTEQPEEVVTYARRGYATVIVAPLRTPNAITLACEQIEALAGLDVPLLLFLDRIAEVRIEVERPGQRPYRRRLHRRQKSLGEVPRLHGCEIYEVDVGESRRYLVARRKVHLERILAAVEMSISSVPQLKRWLDWKGQPEVSVAVGLSTTAVEKGRLYNFLPMGEEADAPLTGYIDAPFFTDIDRRNADLNLPLNKMLMEWAAGACAATALSVVENELRITPQAVFDLFFWTGDHAGKLDYALKNMGGNLREAPVIPVIAERGSKEWANLSQVSIWPEGHFVVMKDRQIVRHVGAKLVSKDLDTRRMERLREVASRTVGSLTPSSTQLAHWSEAFARSLLNRKSAPRTWSSFYNDLPLVFEASNGILNQLIGKEILLDRSGKLRPAGDRDERAGPGVYIRRDLPKGARAKTGVPLPPASLARRYRFLDERIRLKQETLHAFVKGGLIREYSPVEALAGLKAAFAKKVNPKRRQEALDWAFRVWRTAGARVQVKLKDAGLFVPTLSGWQPGSRAVFSSSWTSLGRTLENYLVEAAEVSVDCRRARDLMLVGQQDWPVSVQDAKRDWVRFLELIGVADGLRPVLARVARTGSPTYHWDNLVGRGNAAEGFGEDWCAEVSGVQFNHPYTEDYRMKGEAWRLPGQIEHEKMPESTREALCTLIFKHLETHGTKHFQFQVGRFRRDQRDWDQRVLPTPLAAFLRAKAWIAASTREGMAFRRPRECWAPRVRRGGPPRFIDRVPDTLADFSQGGELVQFAFDRALGLRDWQNQETAIARLRDLAGIAASLVSNERPTARNEYRGAWHDIVETGVSLPPDLELMVTRRGQLEVVRGEPGVPTEIIVTEDAQRFEARILSEAGHPVLEVGSTRIERVCALLEQTRVFVPRRLDGIGVQLLVDGKPFVPRASDPFLISEGLDWLPGVTVIGHELRGEQLERGIQSSTIDRRVRDIRVRRCKNITLVFDDEEVSPSEHLRWYPFEHETLPTMILTDDLSLDWMALARNISGGLSRLIDSRLRSLEPLLLRLALEANASFELDAPSDETLARALDCSVQTVQDHRAALRTDLDHVLDLLAPVVAYYGGIESSLQLRRDVDLLGARLDLPKWLKLHLNDMEYDPERLIDACEQAADRTELRRALELNFEMFNRILLRLGEPTLSNETDLRQLYEAHLARLRPKIIERLRRYYVADFRQGKELTKYVERKSLGFLAFNSDWILTRETLEMELVEAYVSALLADSLGEDVSVTLPSFNHLVEANRKVVREVAAGALPILRVWCRQRGAFLPQLWTQGGQAVVRHLENQGLLDFEPVKAEGVPSLCRRASCWPTGMSETLDVKLLRLNMGDVEEEEKERERQRLQWEITQRRIKFAGSSLDTGDPMFAENLTEVAAYWISKDETWLERSRQRTRLVEFQSSGQSGGTRTSSDVKGGRGRRREQQLNDAHRQAMGLAGEWLAFQYLHQRHSGFVDETCWKSQNRAELFGGDEGDDSAGYDFLIKTPQTDWLYEVKSSLEDRGEFELTANELRVASGASKDGRRRYRILYVPYVFSPDKWCVLELPNPMGEATRNRYKVVRGGAALFRFERR